MSEAFPIIEVSENKLIAMDGNLAHFYRIKVDDLAQKASLEKDRFFRSLGVSLNHLDSVNYFKFYRINAENFLETDAKETPNISDVELIPSSEHLSIFFDDTELFSEISLFDDYLLFNGSYMKVLSVRSFSNEPINSSLIPIDADYLLSVRKIAKQKSLKKLEAIRTKHLSSFLKTKRDVEAEGSYEQAEGLISELTHGEEALFEIELFFFIKDHSLEGLNERVKNLRSHLLDRGVELYLEGANLKKGKSGLSSIFNELIPGVAPKKKLRTLSTKTSHLAYLVPLYHSNLMDSGIRFYDQNFDEIFFNPFNSTIKNKNTLITGESGAGKSVLVNKIIHKLAHKHPTVILDKGGSFRKTTLYHGGFELQSGINPMHFLDAGYLREFVLSVVDKERFNKLERGRLLSKIKEFLIVNRNPDFRDLLIFLEEDFAGISFYFEDIKEHLTDDEFCEYPILYVDVENFPKNIISPLIIYLLQYFKAIPVNEKILVFDECWSFLKDHAAFIDECYRTFRKTGAFPIAITQSLRDFQGLGELSNSITNNSYFKFFFPQELEEASDISSFDRKNMGSLDFRKDEYSDCYLKSADSRFQKIIRVTLDPLELELAPKIAGEDERFYLFLEKNRKYFNSNKEAIDAYVGLKYAKDTNNFNDASSYMWS